MRPLKILVIEDEEMNRILMSRYIKKIGHSSILTSNGGEGIKELELHDFDIVIMDLEMPIMNGYETAAAIRKFEDRVKKHIPILAFTGQTYPALQQQALDAGVDDFIMKPIDVIDLKQKLHLYAGFEHEYNKDERTQNANYETENLETLLELPFEKINLSYLVESAHGDPIFVKRMVSSFVNKTPEYLEDLKKLVSTKEYSGLKTLAHKFKATILITEVKTVAKIIEELEIKIIENRDLDTLERMVDDICNISEIALKEAKQALENLETINQ